MAGLEVNTAQREESGYGTCSRHDIVTIQSDIESQPLLNRRESTNPQVRM